MEEIDYRSKYRAADPEAEIDRIRIGSDQGKSGLMWIRHLNTIPDDLKPGIAASYIGISDPDALVENT